VTILQYSRGGAAVTHSRCMAGWLADQVVSSKMSPEGVAERIEAFLKEWRETLVFEQPFEEFRSSLIASKLQRDIELGSETARHWAVLGRSLNSLRKSCSVTGTCTTYRYYSLQLLSKRASKCSQRSLL
jgi:hypothetical protein